MTFLMLSTFFSFHFIKEENILLPFNSERECAIQSSYEKCVDEGSFDVRLIEHQNKASPQVLEDEMQYYC